MKHSVIPENTCAPTGSKRLFYLDVLRAAACMCIVMIHTSGKFMARDFGSFNFLVGTFFDSLSFVGVPIFVMISGSVFLDEKYNYTDKKLIGHIKKIVIFFVFWSLCYALYYNLLIPLINGEAISILTIIKRTAGGHFHLWYCFMTVGLYLIVPLLRLWVKKENLKQVRYFLILAFIFTLFLPSAIEYLSMLYSEFDSFNSMLDDINLRYVGGFTVYFILGWYLNNIEFRHKKMLYVLGILSLAFSVAASDILSVSFNKTYPAFHELTAHVALQSMAFFVLIRDKFKSFGGKKENGLFYKAVSFIAKYSLGIYAVHVLLLDWLSTLMKSVGITNAVPAIAVMFTAAFGISLLLSFIISKIPLLKKVV